MDVGKAGSSPLTELERLIAHEEIRQLKSRYWAAVDCKRWDEVLEQFTSPEAEITIRMRFPDGRPITTAGEFVEFCSGPYYVGLSSLHMGFNWIITCTSPSQAEASWKFAAVEYPEADNPMGSAANLHFWGYHFDRYEKTARGWRIAFTDFTARTGTFTKFMPMASDIIEKEKKNTMRPVA